MCKIIKLTLCLFVSIIILDLDAQVSFKTKTDLFDKQTIYCELRTINDSIGLNNFIQSYNFKNGSSIEVEPMFRNHFEDEIGRIFIVKLSPTDASENILKQLSELSFLNFAEFAPVLKTFLTPNDLDLKQWHLTKIMAEQAWNIRTGNANIKVAIVDDGVDINHPDLKSNMYVNTAEIAGNGIDDDNNGYIDDRFGWNANYRIGNPNPPIVNRAGFTHGTHCAGITSASTNNGLGIASIGFNISIIPVACADSTSPGYIVSGYEGIVYAVDAGANVISLSWGGSYFSNTGQTIINYARNKNVVVCAAAGNDNSNIMKYPAAYAGVISVAATTSLDKKASFSNYGSWIDVAAPGHSIWSTITGGANQYGYMNGTSMACPMVAGLCGLMLSQNASLKPAELEACLKSSCDNINSLNPNYSNQLGAGRINALNALQCVKPLYTKFTVDKFSICPNGTVVFTNQSSVNATTYLWTITGPVNLSSTLKNPSFVLPLAGWYKVKLLISDGINKDSAEFANYIQVIVPSAKFTKKTDAIKKGEVGFIAVEFIGEIPFTFTYSDGVSNKTLVSYGSPFYIDVTPSKTTQYKLISVTDNRCFANVSDSTIMVVDTNVVVGGPKDTCGRTFDLIAKTIDFGSKENPHHIYQLRDGNIAIVGLSNKGLIGGDDIFLTRMKPNGAVIWTKYFGTTSNEIAYPITVFDDANYNIYIGAASYINNPNTSLFFKLDTFGNIKYARNSVGNSVQDQITEGIQLSNGNIMYMGTSAITNDQAGSAFVVDNNANYVWKKSYNTGGETEHNVHAFELNKRLYMLGRTSVGSGGYGGYYVKMDLTGKTIWQKYIDFSYQDAPMYQVKTDQNTIMEVHWSSYTNSTSWFGSEDVGIVHLDTNGNKIWSKMIGTSGKDNASGFTKLNGYYYLSGITNNFDAGRSKLFVIKLDINGNTIWSKIYGATGETISKPTFGNLLTVASDGSLVVLAQKTNTTDDVLLFKIDQCGNSSCQSQTVIFGNSSVNATISNASFSDLGILNVATPNLRRDSSATGTQVTDKCPPVIVKNNCTVNAAFNERITCFYDSVEFNSASTIGTGKKIRNYKWIFHDNTYIIGSPSVKYKYNSAGTYAVKLIVYSDTSENCSDTVTKSITLPNSISITGSADKNFICVGDSVQLHINSVCAKGPYKISWQPANLFTYPNALHPKAIIRSNTWISYSVKDANGWTAKDSMFITVNTGCCKYSTQLVSQKHNYCVGETFSINSTISYPGANYKWIRYYNNTKLDSVVTAQPQLSPITITTPGLYKYVLVITGTCQQGQNEIEIYVHPLPYVDAGKDTIFCSNGTYAIGMEEVAQRKYKWTPGINISDSLISNPVANVIKTQKYTLIVTDLATGCKDQDTVLLSFGFNKIFLGNDTTLCKDVPFYLKGGTSPLSTKYAWNDGSAAPTLYVRNGGRYILVQTNACGSVSDTIDIKTKDCVCNYTFPNAFSPDDNATNDYFPWENLEFPMDIMIFNRWGEILWSVENSMKGWDGTYKGEIVQQDVYMYIISFKNCKGRREYLKGTFTLLR